MYVGNGHSVFEVRMKAPKWAVGMKQLTPGVYVDAADTMHIDTAMLCAQMGVPHTEANARVLERVCLETLREMNGCEPEFTVVTEGGKDGSGMRGFIGCDADLAPGAEIITGHNQELKVVVIRPATVEEAQACADSMGTGPLVVAPCERFYEVEVTTAPIGSRN
jgi:hypothetical protein